MQYSDFLNYFRDALRAFSQVRFNFSPHSVIYALGQAVASIAAKNQAALNNVKARTSILTAKGTDLEDVLANYSITRKDAARAKGYLRIWRTSLPSTPELIPSGSSFFDEDGKEFVTTEPAVIPSSVTHYPTDIVGSMGSRFFAIPLADGFDVFEYEDLSLTEIRQQLQSSLNVLAQSLETGPDYNIPAATISRGRNSNINVTNPEPFYGGSETETDEQYRLRGLNTIRGANSKFTNSALTAFLQTQVGVFDARIIEDEGCLSFEPPALGTIYAIVNTTSMINDTDNEAQYEVVKPKNIYEEIRNAIEEGGYRPAGIGIVVKEADVHNVNFKSSEGKYIKVYVKDSAVASIKKVELQETLYQFFHSLSIGESVYKSDVIALLKDDPDVIDVADFNFLDITGYKSDGTEIASEVDTLTASCNQVYRARTPQSISVKVVYL